jgi:DNA-binding MarR family transcriptional regulator
MTSVGRKGQAESKRLILGVLAAAEQGGPISQRRLAAELGVALGLTNAYVKRCIRKGHLKVSQAPARRYRYYLTPSGFAEKARLTAEYLSDSLSFFRKARRDFRAVMAEATRRGWTRVALVGLSDLSEIAVLCALEHDITITVVIEPQSEARSFVGIPVVPTLPATAPDVDGLIVTTFDTRLPWIAHVIQADWSDRVLSANLLIHGAPGEAKLVIA